MNEKLEAAKLLHLNKDDSYPLALGRLIFEWLPWNIRQLVIANPEGENNPDTAVLSKEDAILYLGTTLSTIIPYSAIENGLNDIKYDVSGDAQNAYEAICIQSIFDAVKNAKTRLIGEAETPEEVEVVTKTLSDMLAKDQVPNVLNTIATVIANELKKGKAELEKIEDSDNKVIGAGTEDADAAKVPFNPGFEAGANGLDFSGEDEEETVEPTEDKGEDLETTDVDADIAGEEGEIYSEAFRMANNDVLSGSLVYFIKRAISLNAYASLKDSPELADDVNYKARIILSTAGILTLGFALIHLGIMDKKEYAKKVGEHLVPDGKMEEAGEMNEISGNTYNWD